MANITLTLNRYCSLSFDLLMIDANKKLIIVLLTYTNVNHQNIAKDHEDMRRIL